MKKKNFKKLIFDFLDGEVSQEEKGHLEKECRKNKALAEEKSSFEKTIALLKQAPTAQAPLGFTERVMSRIEDKPLSLGRRALRWIISPMDVHLNWALKWSLVFSLILLISAGATWQYLRLQSIHMQVDHLKQQLVTLKNQPVPTRFFFYSPMAKSVHLAGSFNDWDIEERFRLANLGGGDIWSITLMLKPGEYEYMFLVDQKEWVTDPGAMDSRFDGFGHRNSIVEVSREI